MKKEIMLEMLVEKQFHFNVPALPTFYVIQTYSQQCFVIVCFHVGTGDRGLRIRNFPWNKFQAFHKSQNLILRV